MSKTCNFTAPWGERYENAIVQRGAYVDGSMSLQVFSQIGEPLTTASLNLGDYGYKPAEGCIFVGDYSQHKGIFEALIKAGVLSDTGRVVKFGPHNTSAREGAVNPAYLR